jgi:hypothetical protein
MGIDSSPLPLQGKPERRHLYRWMRIEEQYVADKFKDERQTHDKLWYPYQENTVNQDWMDPYAFWLPQIEQYHGRVAEFLNGANLATNQPDRRFLILKAQQAMAKAMMTSKGMVESSIRVFGNLPLPGQPSGEVRHWGVSQWDQG